MRYTMLAVERSTRRRHLLDDGMTVRAVVEHALDPANLAALSLFVVPILYAIVAPHATHTPATHVPMPASELVTPKEYQPA